MDEEIKKENSQAEEEPEKEQESLPKAEKNPEGKKKKKEKSVSEIESLKELIKDKEDKFLRLAAEYDNFRKRSAKEKSDIYSSSQTEIVKQLLPIIDNFDRAANNTTASPEDYRKGMELIFNQFTAMLDKLGITGFGEPGEEFDPNIHSAVMMVDDENFESNQIVSVFSKGYKLGEKIIRPAMVTVNNQK
ncbi:MAG: nucleotide exchange factor GrpE [Clostridiales bacterium]|nr:nucleotide exchange factor GrpE [Clostridiales bacterium]